MGNEMKIEAYKSLNGKIYENEKDAIIADEEYKIENLSRSINGWLDHMYPSNYGITQTILVELRNNYGPGLSKKKIEDLIEKLDEYIEDERL